MRGEGGEGGEEKEKEEGGEEGEKGEGGGEGHLVLGFVMLEKKNEFFVSFGFV